MFFIHHRLIQHIATSVDLLLLHDLSRCTYLAAWFPSLLDRLLNYGRDLILANICESVKFLILIYCGQGRRKPFQCPRQSPFQHHSPEIDLFMDDCFYIKLIYSMHAEFI